MARIDSRPDRARCESLLRDVHATISIALSNRHYAVLGVLSDGSVLDAERIADLLHISVDEAVRPLLELEAARLIASKR